MKRNLESSAIFLPSIPFIRRFTENSSLYFQVPTALKQAYVLKLLREIWLGQSEKHSTC